KASDGLVPPGRRVCCLRRTSPSHSPNPMAIGSAPPDLSTASCESGSTAAVESPHHHEWAALCFARVPFRGGGPNPRTEACHSVDDTEYTLGCRCPSECRHWSFATARD